MPRYRAEKNPKCSDKISVFTFLFPVLSVLYAEGIFSFFAETGFYAYKILFALAAGCVAEALSHITPVRVLNFLLQTAWLLFCWGMIVGQFLCMKTSGTYFSLFTAAEDLPALPVLLTAAIKNIPFIVCMLAPAVLQFTVQRGALLHKRSLLGTLLGANWLEAPGMLLLAVILAFVSVTMAFYADSGEASPRRQMEIGLMPEASVETFGVLPETVLDFKYNVLSIAEEEIIHNYVVTEDGQQIEITEDDALALEGEV